MYNCSNGEPILWTSHCDGFEDCSDGSDETKELCALYEFETNMNMDCGRVRNNMKNQVTPDVAHQSITELAPWTVGVYGTMEKSKFLFLQPGSIIAPNIVITWGFDFVHRYGIKSKQFPINDGRFKVGSIIDFMVTMIYLTVKDILVILVSMMRSKL
ncbi:uncharacterized protein LOC132946244 isoform X2 [Metopolophium dirhodum]|uniref:uncharacterized protein LOC132946244 isoform X2 n=1 Tax=Metopolophium dirhodum TaxID=44670 RepID=UPI0029903C9D|nr:uncharacterized protein LOC132946244 isoform X2 [Metopolophium dirhodum]